MKGAKLHGNVKFSQSFAIEDINGCRVGCCCLRIEVIGRAKTSIKLSMGKWVFPESLETLFRAAVSKDGVRHVWVHGDSQHDSLIAAAWPKIEALQNASIWL